MPRVQSPSDDDRSGIARWRQIPAVCGAIWGVALAGALAPALQRPAQPGQLLGPMSAAGLDSRGPYLLLLLVPFLALAGAILTRLTTNRFGRARTGAKALAAACLAGALPIALAGGGPGLVLLMAAVALFFLRFGAADLRWSRHDLLLAPTFLAMHLALLEIFIGLPPVSTAVAAAVVVTALRFVLAQMPKHVPPGLLLTGLPLALLAEVRLISGHRPGDAIVAAVLLCGLPFAAYLSPERILRRTRYLALPAAAVLYTHILAGYPTPVFNLFEHGFGLINASEMLRGRVLYRDVVPTHGPLADGIIDWLGMKLGGPTLGAALTARYFVALLTPLACFAAAAAATGSLEVALLAVVGATFVSPSSVNALAELSPLLFLRAVPSIFSAAAAAFSLRKRATRWLLAAGALAAVAWFTSIDFGLYAVAVAGFAAFRFSRSWSGRAAALTRVLGGFAAVVLPVLVWLAIRGLLGAYLRVTFLEVPALSSAYTIGFPGSGDCCGSRGAVAALLAATHDAAVFPFVSWIAVVVALAATLAASPFGSSRRAGPLLVLCAWIVCAGMSFAERKHLYFLPLLPVLFGSLLWNAWRDRRPGRWPRPATAGAVLLAVIATGGGAHVLAAMPDAVRDRHDLVEEQLAPWPAVPRAAGVLLRKEDIARLELIRDALAKSAPDPGTTFFSFTNVPSLYFLFDRAVPVRYPEVPMFAPPAVQREILAALQNDRSVRVALVSFPFWADRIDGIPNAARAPQVFDYLRRNFRPVYARDGLVMLAREEPE
jgi:hypothetical protein